MQSDLKVRTKKYALETIRVYGILPKTTEAQILGKQVLRSATSIGAHYREAHRGRSDAEFVSKLETALQELEETQYWLELLEEANIVPHASLFSLQTETKELIAIFTTSVKTVKARIAAKNQLSDR
jgi:four helix bundle protein